jgi:hypothetical protein
MITRRAVLKGSAFLSLSPIVLAFLERTARSANPERDGRVLVTLQLDGGNDGINTVVPFGDQAYAKCRRELRLPTDKLFKIGDGLGLHPSMRAAADLLETGRLAIVQGVGYPNPNRSHFESMNIWQTAKLGKPGVESLGWLGRALDQATPVDGPAAVFVGDENLPLALFARRAISASFADASDLNLTLPGPPGSSPPAGDDLSGSRARMRPPQRSRPGRLGQEIPARAIRRRDWRVGSSWSPARSRPGRPCGSSTSSNPGMTRTRSSCPHRRRFCGSLPGPSRRSWMTWRRRNWPTGLCSWPSANSAAVPRRTARSAPTTVPPGLSSWPAPR